MHFLLSHVELLLQGSSAIHGKYDSHSAPLMHHLEVASYGIDKVATINGVVSEVVVEKLKLPLEI